MLYNNKFLKMFSSNIVLSYFFKCAFVTAADLIDFNAEINRVFNILNLAYFSQIKKILKFFKLLKFILSCTEEIWRIAWQMTQL